MRTISKWYLSLSVLGLGGIGALLLSGRGRRAVLQAVERLRHAPEQLDEWNGATRRELERIQDALDRVAKSVQPAR